MNNKAELMDALKKVKNFAPTESARDGADQSNVEILEPKQVVNG